jgi:hypothetical protein
MPRPSAARQVRAQAPESALEPSDELAEAIDLLTDLAGRVRQVQAVHRPVRHRSLRRRFAVLCACCGAGYPCPTRQLLALP